MVDDSRTKNDDDVAGTQQQQQQQQQQQHTKNYDGHLPLHWLQPIDDKTESILPSFRDLQQKTHQTLYGSDTPIQLLGRRQAVISIPRDKSPIGSVDPPIQHLVDLINCHSRFCTLSSCSGRMSLFDPNGRSSSGSNNNGNGNGNNDDDDGKFTEASGKGRGSWILLHPYMILLHIAAASLNDGRKLLTIALNLGFRESGLVVTDKRVTVAIRSNSLSTATPLFPPTYTTNNNDNNTNTNANATLPCVVPVSYLRFLVEDANTRLEANWNLLDRLYRSIESTLFEIQSVPPPITIIPRHSNTNRNIPPLNLWNAAAATVMVTTTTSTADVAATIATTTATAATSDSQMTPTPTTTKQQLWIAGGYGCGPTSSKITTTASIAAKRSSTLYKLERELMSCDAAHGDNDGGVWQEQWQAYDRPSNNDDDNNDNDNSYLYLPTVPSPSHSKQEIALNSNNSNKKRRTRLGVRWFQDEEKFPDLQGMTSCRLEESGLVLFWGGRKGPTKPSLAETIYVFENSSNTCVRFGTVIDVRGDLPRSRWGHGLVPLSTGNRAILMGGCNMEDGAVDDVFVLHLCTEDQPQKPGGRDSNDDSNDDANGYFYWERLSIRLPTPRFHFGSALLKRDTIVVVGGLQSTQQLLQPFEHDNDETTTTIWACRFGDSKKKKKNKICIPSTKATVVPIDPHGCSPLNSDTRSLFGTACCTMMSNNLLVITGGIQHGKSIKSTPLQAYWISNNESSSSKVSKLRLQRIALGYDHNSMNHQQVDRKSTTVPIDFGSLVHHCCITISDNEFLLVGGGVASFAFGECYARSHHILIDTNNSRGSSTDDHGTQNSLSNLSVRTTKKSILDSDNLPCQTGDSKTSNGEAAEMTNVVYVAPKHARQAKNTLHQKGWLDKRYRMIKVMTTAVNTPGKENNEEKIEAAASSQQLIVVPISVPFTEVLSVCNEWIIDHGQKEMPFSTSQYASKSN
ncbi:hypothetical protein FRACYDRAFT_251007 [Fragilariopsis cylindrus CCMP1102]|uniref:tRNA(Phe) 7-[(3-amino-3-carboxypropyl)-4-demethylwyosine(37)-N(4)]-methyltransferase n=1 Tax=Fragilariopsis cylindrus CCMP1102 TaxID=635003 RepID=A0A1E7EP76_9STRA|nr:hypothetical protein FRACYDRAFT_251007 [Fragilariopsis cylindrus CCMP1102]|eukprot:OEU07586.1 hypothetical protein FRACYDRAFT_251007 [Fragilariopsis cylindrus CCMP1102]